MLELKDLEDIDSYSYQVCEILSCEHETTDFYEEGEHAINVCDRHYKELDNNRYSC